MPGRKTTVILNSLVKMGTVSPEKHDQQGTMVAVIDNDRSMMTRMRHEREMVMKYSGVTKSVVVLK